MNNQDELKHYGVLGMKWGMRKAHAKGNDYTYKSYGQKKFEKKVNKLTAKASKKNKPSYRTTRKLENAKVRLDKYKQRDKNRQDYARSTTVGRSIAKTLLFGPLGSGNYNRYRAAGHGRVASALVSNVLASTAGYPIRGKDNHRPESRGVQAASFQRDTPRRDASSGFRISASDSDPQPLPAHA